MHADWDNGSNADFSYISADDARRSYRTRHAPKAKRRTVRSNAAKPSGIYRRRNNRWGW